MELSHDVVPYLDDNVQLSIEEYRGKLYEVCVQIEYNYTVDPLSEHHGTMQSVQNGTL